MRDEKVLVEWLNYTARTLQLRDTPTEEAQKELNRRVASGWDITLWRALLDDGWTMEGLAAKYEEMKKALGVA